MAEQMDSALDLYIPGVSKVTPEQIRLARLTVCQILGRGLSKEAAAAEVRRSLLLEELGLTMPQEAGLLESDDGFSANEDRETRQ